VLHLASLELVAEAKRRAGELFDTSADDVEYSGGVLRVRGRETTLAALAAGTPLIREGEFRSPQSFPFGCYVAVVEIDPELGTVAVLRRVGVDDPGVVLNPSIVDGQIRGSIVQGLGQAFYEEVVHDAEGRPVAETLLDYLLPTVSELPGEVILD